MKYSSTLILILALLGAIHSQAEEVLPSQFNFDRYSKMVDHSPFAVATEVAAPAATPDFAKDLYIANIEWSDKVGATKVTISKDGNFATLTFNQALLSQSAPNPGLASRAFAQPMPPAPNPATGVPNPVSQNLPPGLPAEVQQLIPSKEAARPHARGLIQRNPNPNIPARVPNRAPATSAAAKQ